MPERERELHGSLMLVSLSRESSRREVTYSARSEDVNPVPYMITSHSVPSSVSMANEAVKEMNDKCAAALEILRWSKLDYKKSWHKPKVVIRKS